MKSVRFQIAVVLTLLLHAAGLAAILWGLAVPVMPTPEKPPVSVALIAPEVQAAKAPLAEPSEAPPPPSPPPQPPSQPPSPSKPPPIRRAQALKSAPKPMPPQRVPARPVQAQPDQPTVAAPAPAPAPSSPPSPAPVQPTPAPPPPRTGVNIPASYAASNRKPEQPAMSRRYGEQGTVMLRVLVKADGTAGNVEIRTSSGFSLLDEAAKNAVETWRFNPATLDGKAVADWYLVPVTFKLKN